MDTQAYTILRAICDFLEGLFFGYCIITLLAVVIFLLYKKKELRTFIHHAVLVARNLAIFYFVLYSISLVTYYTSKEFIFFTERATGTYAHAYWFMLIRPLVFCGLLQLFWIKKIATKLRYIALITILVLIVSLFSASFFEKIVIITAAYHRDVFIDDSNFNADVFIIIASYIIENAVLFSALVFISWAVFRNRKLN